MMHPLLCTSLSWRASILKEHGMSQPKCIVCIKSQSQSQLIVRSAVITSVLTVLLCGQEREASVVFESYRHDTKQANTIDPQN